MTTDMEKLEEKPKKAAGKKGKARDAICMQVRQSGDDSGDSDSSLFQQGEESEYNPVYRSRYHEVVWQCAGWSENPLCLVL